ncbi:hypothetical protein TCAL_00698 [Tigriopus californicus]|uniref:HMG box domain-containing protein n=1 Tax=Tigriopus californicus TaxID=6832 RepID=A0A553PCF8_TIGCA|nr:high mobility group protein B3-like [Tigriopus californicus]TRY75371.1 hypothetical protein TCAL_00698 [Tigriopus californicus]|eukprot:TCALIF_00698-PA protein Name:"Similar to Hmgb3 High mobility group protein B3 (Mus musculus)" AED:0.09 eAED:0.09 QI:0/-1/0/1/-1/1/1/0/184
MPRVSTKNKDPHAPKRGLSAFMLYSGEVRPKIRASNPDMPVTEVAKVIGARWAEVSDEEKARFNALAAKDKKRYEAAMEVYEPPPTAGSDADENANRGAGLKRKMKASADPNRVKKPTSAYFYFMAAVRPSLKEKHPDKKLGEMAKIMGEMWAKYTDEEKQPFVKKAMKDKARYEEEKQAQTAE